jgi:hypothetical protein
VTIKPRSSPYQRRQINHLATDGVLAKDRSGKGCASARVHVFIDNTPAERVYSAVGFTVAGEKRDRAFELFFGAPGIKLLKRNLLVSG